MVLVSRRPMMVVDDTVIMMDLLQADRERETLLYTEEPIITGDFIIAFIN
jgi:hypothetical protein